MSKTTDEKLDMLLEGMTFMRQELTEVKNEQQNMNKRLDKIENTVTLIENTHGAKLSIIFDKLEQHDEKLDMLLDAAVKELKEEEL